MNEPSTISGPATAGENPLWIEVVTDTYVPDINGVALSLGRFCAGLRERGHRVEVIRSGRAEGEGDVWIPWWPLPGYWEIRVGAPWPGQLRRRWQKHRPDVVYVAIETPLGYSAVAAARRLGIPVVGGFHTNFREYLRKYGMVRFSERVWAYQKWFHERLARTLVPSPDAREKLVQAGFSRVGVLGRGVDTGLFHPSKRNPELRREWGATGDAPVVLLVGRVSSEKNIELAIRAFDRMRQSCPQVVCVVVGDGPVRARLERENPGVKFVGYQLGEKLAACYASADILLFPSETETFGNVLLEGMASGLATVSFDYAAAGQHVRSGWNGLKAARGNSPEFIRHALDALMMRADHDLRRAARETAEQLGWENVIGEFEQRLAEIAEIPQGKGAKRTGKRPKLSCRTVFLSDIHLGTPASKADEVVEFLKHIRCRKLVLNGDIIDGWALRRGAKWSSRHSRVIRKVIKMTENDDTEVVYLRGNHDEILERFLPMVFGKIRLTKEHIHITSAGKRYLVVHGDGFDSVSTNHKWIASLGAVGYDFLLGVNRVYNAWRAWRGKEYYSLSKRVKAKVKSAVSFVDRYEVLLQDLARLRKCDGIICGHIHTPEDKQVGAVHYLNSGDWVESLTAIIEHNDGRMELVRYEDFLTKIRQRGQEDAAEAAEACMV